MSAICCYINLFRFVSNDRFISLSQAFDVDDTDEGDSENNAVALLFINFALNEGAGHLRLYRMISEMLISNPI